MKSPDASEQLTSGSKEALEMYATDSAPSLPGQERFKVWTCEELDAETFDFDYIVENVLLAGQPCVLAGPAKSLKTSIAVDLAISVATATPFLGKFPVERPRAVAFFSGESGAAAIRKLLVRACDARSVKLSLVPLLQMVFEVPRLDDEKQLAEVERIIRERGIELLIIDPVYLALGGDDAANVFKQGEKLRAIGRICEQNGVTLLLLHHYSRGASRQQGNGPATLDDLAYAGFTEFARQWLLLKRRNEYRVGSGYHDLRLTIGASAGHQGDYGLEIDEGNDERGRGWAVRVLTADELEREQRRRSEHKAKGQSDLDRRVVAHLSANERQAVSDIRKALEGSGKSVSHANVEACLQRLEIESAITSELEQRPRRRDPVKVYSLATVDSD